MALYWNRCHTLTLLLGSENVKKDGELMGVDMLYLDDQAVKKGDTIFVGQYVFTGTETTSV